jgi:hypothetical protein
MLLAIFNNFGEKDEEISILEGEGGTFLPCLPSLLLVAVTFLVDWPVHIFITCISTGGVAMIPLLHAPHSLEFLHAIFNNFYEEDMSILQGQH